MPTADTPPGPITLRTDLRPGDLGAIVSLHGAVYARERGFDPTFEAYVAGPLAEFARSTDRRQRLWIKRLLREAVAFCKECGYADVILWTESVLTAAAHLYQSVGFRKTEEKPGRLWGVDLVDEKYELVLGE